MKARSVKVRKKKNKRTYFVAILFCMLLVSTGCGWHGNISYQMKGVQDNSLREVDKRHWEEASNCFLKTGDKSETRNLEAVCQGMGAGWRHVAQLQQSCNDTLREAAKNVVQTWDEANERVLCAKENAKKLLKSQPTVASVEKNIGRGIWGWPRAMVDISHIPNEVWHGPIKDVGEQWGRAEKAVQIAWEATARGAMLAKNRTEAVQVREAWNEAEAGAAHAAVLTEKAIDNLVTMVNTLENRPSSWHTVPLKAARIVYQGGRTVWGESDKAKTELSTAKKAAKAAEEEVAYDLNIPH